MDYLAAAAKGFEQQNAGDDIIRAALEHLEKWLTAKDFADYRPQVHWLIETEQWKGLLDRFYQILPFGTGGRRGAVGVGPNRMNLWTLGASVQGHCEYLREQFPDFEKLSVVLAFDVRRFEDAGGNYNSDLPNPVLQLTSKDFARRAACIYAANGMEAHILDPQSDRYLATPELSFAIRHLNAHGGLNVSASHNPPDDNGGKFYDDRGGQPIPPEDQIMAELVDQVGTIRVMDWRDAVRQKRIVFLSDSIHERYIDLCRKQSLIESPRRDELQVVFTPLHGVGGMTALEVLEAQGFSCLTVKEQMTPDGRFPNVTKSPNPEVPESMDRAAELAADNQADLVMATDPDADRLGALIPRGDASRIDNWRPLDGNETAAVLTYFKLKKMGESGSLPDSPIVIKTLVTTNLVARIARGLGAQLADGLLVGCKYIADVMWQLEKDGVFHDVQGSPADVVIGTEESHGYLLTPAIRDKDGASAALVLAEAALDCKRRGESIWDLLNDIWRQFGYFRNVLRPVVLRGLEGKQQMARMLDSLRNEPPTEIGGLSVTGFDDLRNEDNWLGPIQGATDYAARNFLVYQLGDAGRVSLRPSGTEPKAKAYVEIATPPHVNDQPESDWLDQCRQADTLAERIATDFLEQALARIGLQP